ncbi:MAG: LuxR C-terminal-related transcriptional regulator [Myxococcota bacterium]
MSESAGISSVVVVEDDGPTRAYLVSAIEATEGLTLAGQAENVAMGCQLVAAHRPRVLLVDLQLPDGIGLEIIEAAKQSSPETLCLVITTMGDEQSVLSAIAAGAQGYLLKDSTAQRIGGSVLDLIAGGAPISPPIARHLLLRFQTPASVAAEPATAEPETGEDSASLSARETEVLELVVKGFTFPEIGRGLEISTHTVTTHVRRIYKKLAVRSRSEAVYEALQQGIVSVASDGEGRVD